MVITMNKLAKVLSVVLSIVMVVGVCVVMFSTAFAADKPTFSLNVVSEDATSAVVSVKLESGKFQNGTFKVNLSGNATACTKIARGDALRAAEAEAEDSGNIITFAPNAATGMAALASTADLGTSGVYVQFTLSKKSNADITKADVTLTVADIDANVVNNLPGTAPATTTTTSKATETTTTTTKSSETTTTTGGSSETTTTTKTSGSTATTASTATSAESGSTTTTTTAGGSTPTTAATGTPATTAGGQDTTSTVVNPSTGDGMTASAGIVAVLALSAAAVVALRKKED